MLSHGARAATAEEMLQWEENEEMLQQIKEENT